MRHPVWVKSVELSSVDDLMALLADCHDVWDMPDKSGDPVDILDHGLQVATLLANAYPDDPELQVAGLVHDIGHYLVPADEAGHGDTAADAVRPLLGERVAGLVAAHIPAKRYLVATEPGLVLSQESLRTLGCQGGPMTPGEVTAFEAWPDFAAAIALRRADDAGKVVGLKSSDLAAWRSVVERVAQLAVSRADAPSR
jgi:predicted HD phosphohydrolase